MFLVVLTDDNRLFIEPDDWTHTIPSNNLKSYQIVDAFRYYYEAEDFYNMLLSRRYVHAIQ